MIVARIKYNAFKIVLIARQIKVGIIFVGDNTLASEKFNLLIKPANKGIPTIEREPTIKPMPAILLRKPEPLKSENNLLSPDTTDNPFAEMNNRAFEAAWERMWNTAA